MPPAALLLTHGAGGGADHPTLVALEEGLDALYVERLEFPYRRAGRRAPDRAPVLIASIREAVDALCAQLGIGPERVVLGGRSMGGRMCSMAVAEGLPAAGLVLLSYPLHPPGKPERLRVEHFADVEVPCLFLGGDRDPFGSPEELEAAVGALGGRVLLSWLAGARHDPRGLDDRILEVVRSWLATLP